MKKRRASVLCRCTWYMRQPGSLRDSSVSLENTADTSVSRPTFAIPVTARTTIVRSVFLLLPLYLGSSASQIAQSFGKLVDKDCLFPPRSGGNYPNAGSALLFDERQIIARYFRQLLKFGD